jgi:hypothetical protein
MKELLAYDASVLARIAETPQIKPSEFKRLVRQIKNPEARKIALLIAYPGKGGVYPKTSRAAADAFRRWAEINRKHRLRSGTARMLGRV